MTGVRQTRIQVLTTSRCTDRRPFSPPTPPVCVGQTSRSFHTTRCSSYCMVRPTHHSYIHLPLTLRPPLQLRPYPPLLEDGRVADKVREQRGEVVAEFGEAEQVLPLRRHEPIDRARVLHRVQRGVACRGAEGTQPSRGSATGTLVSPLDLHGCMPHGSWR